jgi:alcohol dehydrogenase class IV
MFQFATATQIIFGAGALNQLTVLARGLGQSAFLVLGAGERQRARVEELLAAAGVRVQVGRVRGEPTVQDVLGLVQSARAAGTQLVLGVGGGSVIDAAKALAALLPNPGDPLDFLELVGRGRALDKPSLPLIAVPTTSGTGAEVTKNAVLAASEQRVKVSLRSDSMLPRVALIDPDLTLSVPPAVTASTGLDALTQCLEPYVSCKSNPITDALSRQGLERGAGALRRAFRDGADRDARSDMALVSLFGGLSLANAKLGAVHGFAGPIGGRYPAPHGAVCARLLPLVVERNVRALRARAPQHPALERYQDIARIFSGRADADALDAVDWLGELVNALEIPRLSAYGLDAAAVPELVARAQVSSSMQGNPIVLTTEELALTLEAAI